MAQLLITEKPRVAEKLAQALAEGEIQRKRFFDVTYYELKRGGKKILIAPAVGHIYTLKQTKKGSDYPVFDIEWAPSHAVDKGAKFTKGYLQTLEKLAKESDECVNSCDYDIEGSLIGYNVIRFACKGKPAKRMKFSALTKEDLIEAYENRSALDVNNALAGETRHILDWFYGINLSRALMHAIKTTGMYKVMSIGRVQGPSLQILTTREREIARFKAEPYWQLFAHHGKLIFSHEIEKFFKKEEAETHFAESEKNRSGAKIASVTRTKKKVAPNPPFDLTSLQVEAFRALHFSPAMTLSLSQSLYEASLISYPRTASQKLPAKLNFPKIMTQLSKQTTYSQLAQKLVAAGKFKPREGEKDDPAHPAIHPTGMAPENDVGERERKLYDLIVRRFLACFAEDAVRESMRVDILLGPEKYFVTGARTVEQGWFEYYGPYVKIEEVTLPNFVEGQGIQIDKIELAQKETQPPKRYTEASLIQALEKKDLGTKATRAVVIETLHKRNYITGRTSLTVTPFGVHVVHTLEKHAHEILDEKLTRDFEMKMDAITEGKIAPKEIVEEGKRILTATLMKFKKEEKEVGSELAGTFTAQRAEQETLGKCPKCKMGDMRILRARASGKQFAACNRYPECKTTYPLPQAALIIKTGNVCDQCGTPKYIVRRKGRRDFEMCLDPKCPTKANWGKKEDAAVQTADKKSVKGVDEQTAGKEPEKGAGEKSS